MRRVYEKFESANIIGVTVEHNGYCGGDAGHGGYVKIKFLDLGGTCMELNGNECIEFELCFRGDSERDTLIDSLRMIINELDNNKVEIPF